MASRVFLFARTAALTVALAAPILAGCGVQLPTPTTETEPPASPPVELYGAPATPPPAAPPPPRSAPAEPPPVITMAPIPNPPETAPTRRARPDERPSVQRPPVQRPTARPAAPPRPAARPPAVARAEPARRPPPVQPARAVAPPRPTAPVAPAPAPAARVAPAAPAANIAAPAAPPAAGGVATLQAALTKLVPEVAQLLPPAETAANQPGEATLTLAADFADAVKREAAAAGLGDAGASANLTARLSGDGYAISPDETQSMPLIGVQPTVFHWTVVPRTGSPGPLSVKLGADLLGGGGATLDLGTVRSPGTGPFAFTPRLIGLGLLLLIALIVVVWATRRRNHRSKEPSAAERRAIRRAVRDGRPMDLHEKDIF